jgi:serine/threonine protein kinase
MTDESHSAKSIFGKALEIESPEQRAAYLSEACATSPQLRGEVEDLLQAFEDAGSYLHGPALRPPATLVKAVIEKPGTRIGPYKLLEKIGEGGFGVVYLAEQTEPVRRQVALKIIKPGMDSRQVIARFEAEQQALALMDHPSIARIYDAGVTGKKSKSQAPNSKQTPSSNLQKEHSGGNSEFEDS